MPQVAAVVVAAGQGLRAGGDTPKQVREIGGASLLRRSLLGFAGVPAVSALQPVVRKDDIDLVREHTHDIRILPPVFGGATRQA
ncbi:MAG TPA: 2-C-methyl-D-erythritol 4-phosphate cytidylyltransferase, partial [Pseudolabrys sp.]|nr:2-C-methyl-D-erythritol 4-phosphate cytidylyltransferase [Pseudolabrys sp.]